MVNSARRRTAGWKAGALLAALATGGAQAAAAQDHAGQYEQADIEFGARLYDANCVRCHAEAGDAVAGGRPRRRGLQPGRLGRRADGPASRGHPRDRDAAERVHGFRAHRPRVVSPDHARLRSERGHRGRRGPRPRAVHRPGRLRVLPPGVRRGVADGAGPERDRGRSHRRLSAAVDARPPRARCCR